MTIRTETENDGVSELVEDLRQHQFELTQQNEELRRTQTELNQATEKYRDLWNQAPIGYVLHNRAGVISDANARACHILRTNDRQITGRTFDRFLSKDSRLIFRQHLLSTATTPDSAGVEVQIDGSVSPEEVWVRLQSLVTPDGEYRTALIDVTERRKAEADRVALASQLQHAQKMDVLHELSAGIAHDFNNVLQIITASGDIVQSQLRLQNIDETPIETLLHGARRGAELTARLLAFSRRSAMRATRVDLRKVIASTVTVIRRVLGENIVLRHAPSSSCLPVEVDGGLIEQALLNLCINARDAMPEGGRLFVSERKERLDTPGSISGITLPPGEYVAVTVADNGVGMSSDVLDKVFEPFFTTKGSGSGTGLGLAIVYGIVRQHGGSVKANSTPGQGTQFTIFLPTVPHDLEDHTPPGLNNDPVVSDGGTILVAEDEAAIRDILSQILRSSGYEVVTAEDGHDAIRQLASVDFDLVLTDVMMPNASGKTVCESVHADNPDMPVIFLTGHGDGVIDKQFLEDHQAILLNKPLRSAELLAAVASSLADSSRARRS